MKVRPSVKPMCEKCKIIRRHGKVMVICSRTPSTSRSKAEEYVAGSGCKGPTWWVLPHALHRSFRQIISGGVH